VKEVVQLVEEMQAAGVIQNYALFGAIAQMRYTEPIITFDVDVLIALAQPGRIDALSGVYQFCAEKGYQPEGEAIRVGAWPVQFLPAYSGATREALENVEMSTIEGLSVRVVRPDYLAAIALDTGRAKDHARILALLESGKTSREQVEACALRLGLGETWKRFAKRFLDG
jgi:hypothetical protein